MSSKKTTTTFKSSLSKLGGGSASGMKRENLLQGFTPSSSINFGKPSDRKALISSASTGMDWAGWRNKWYRGAASLFNASSAVGLGGLGSLISGITSLFGGGEKKAPPPLQLFQLPDAVNQTVHVQAGLGRLGGSRARSSDGHAIVVNRSNDIARAVKTAMLNSHSLNDVVSEL